MIFGIFATMLTAKGLDMADAKFNFSGMYPKASSFGGMSPDDAQKTSMGVSDVKNPALTKVDDLRIMGAKSVEGNSNVYKEINIHGKINTELDEVDLVHKIIYEDKSAEKLYMENPDFPQTEVQWAEKQIFKKGSNRISSLQQPEFKLSSQVSANIPSVDELKNINDYVFRIDADTPKLRDAVQTQLEKLKTKYPEFNFSATYGGKK